MNIYGIPILGALTVLVHVHVAAQTAPTGALDARTPGVPLRYESAFSDYKPYQDLPLANWRQVNDAVRDAAGPAGGPAGHDVKAPPSVSGSASAETPKPSHDANHMNGAKP